MRPIPTLARRILPLALAAALLSPPAAASPARIAPERSGLPWASGMSCFDRSWSRQPQLEAWRGRKLDVVKGWAPRKDWASMLKWFKGGGLKSLKESGARLAIGVTPVPDKVERSFDACASGAFDSYFRAIGRILVDRGVPNTIIRLAWEANGSWFPWSAGKDPEGYKQCFRQAAETIKGVDKRLLIEWPMAGKGHLPFSVERIYPGDDVVDIVGITLYDRYPTATTQAVWDDLYMKTHLGGPYGPGAWVEFAKRHGKPLGIGEWGVSDGFKPGVGSDNPLFIENVFAFFARNAGHIAYETYYNCQENGIYRLYPKAANPKASSAYQRLWRAGPKAVTLRRAPEPLAPEAADAVRYLEWFQKNVRQGRAAKASKHWTLYVAAAKRAGLPLWQRWAVKAEVRKGAKVSALSAPG